MFTRRIAALAAALLGALTIAAATTGGTALAARGLHTVSVQAAGSAHLLVAQPDTRFPVRRLGAQPDTRCACHPASERLGFQPDFRAR